MAVLHHHRLVSGQRVGDAVLTFTVHSLKQNKQLIKKNLLHITMPNQTQQMDISTI